ncbi:MAG: FAD-dependent oxidoreductase [Proteobacteria bacterium]|nr:FAD-dependent oxidoreductase [Pseudomonadota bacterium]
MPRDGAQPTIILGGGLTGISAALHLRRPYLLVERESRLGGLARTNERDGFFFDHTGHWLHLRTDAMRALAQRVMGEALVEVERRAAIYSHGVLTPYPFQANLHGLPPPVVYECLLGFVQARLQRGSEEPRNFEQYVLHHFGAGIARHFMLPYNSKLWGVPPAAITSAWCSRFVPIPTLEQVLAGAVGAGPAALGYNVRFVYPRQGGIESFTRALVAELDPSHTRLGTAPEAIDPRAGTVAVAGEALPFHALITSLPLPTLLGLLVDAPAAVLAAGERLRATPVRYLDVATRRPARADYHWAYVPEERYPFYRVGVFSNAMPSMAPPGCASLYVELSRREGDAAQATREALEGLVAIGAIDAVEDVLFAELRELAPAYVVFDEGYESAVATIQSYLAAHRIFSCGRYGAWIYNAMEDSLLAGRQAAAETDALALRG